LLVERKGPGAFLDDAVGDRARLIDPENYADGALLVFIERLPWIIVAPEQPLE
jgi:hypothetical protein